MLHVSAAGESRESGSSLVLLVNQFRLLHAECSTSAASRLSRGPGHLRAATARASRPSSRRCLSPFGTGRPLAISPALRRMRLTLARDDPSLAVAANQRDQGVVDDEDKAVAMRLRCRGRPLRRPPIDTSDARANRGRNNACPRQVFSSPNGGPSRARARGAPPDCFSAPARYAGVIVGSRTIFVPRRVPEQAFPYITCMLVLSSADLVLPDGVGAASVMRTTALLTLTGEAESKTSQSPWPINCWLHRRPRARWEALTPRRS